MAPRRSIRSSATRASRNSCSLARSATRLRLWINRRRSKMSCTDVMVAWLPAARYIMIWCRRGPMYTPHLASRAERAAHGVAAALRRTVAACADLIVPPCCLVCRARVGDHHLLCPVCWRDVHFIRAPLCDVLGIPLPFDTGGRMVSAAAVAYPPAWDRARAVAH